jgi:hypothetical protein
VAPSAALLFVGIRTASKIPNHADPGTTAVYDRHSYDKEKREALEAWSKD